MPKKLFWFITVATVMFFPVKIEAQCSNAQIVRLASLGQNVAVTYDPIETNGKVSFNITITNLHQDIYIKDITKRQEYYYNNSSEITLSGYLPNTTYRFDIYGHGECNKKVYSHYVTLPGYNPYYGDPICNGLNHNICQKWVNITYDYKTYVEEVNKIKMSLIKTEEEIIEEEPMGIYDYILEFFISYYYIILPIIIIGGSITINYLRKKDDLF